jgi:hypothetical protein
LASVSFAFCIVSHRTSAEMRPRSCAPQCSQATGRGFDPHRPLQKILKIEGIRWMPVGPRLLCMPITSSLAYWIFARARFVHGQL